MAILGGQVKSSQNPFCRADVGEWAEELKTWRDAHGYELVLIGTPESPFVAQMRVALAVEVRYHNLGSAAL